MVRHPEIYAAVTGCPASAGHDSYLLASDAIKRPWPVIGVVDAERLEGDEETRVRIGDDRDADVALQAVDDLRRLPLRTRQIERVADTGAAQHFFGKRPDVGGRDALQSLERHVHAFGVGDRKAVPGEIVRHGAIVPLRIGRRDRDAPRADVAQRFHGRAHARGGAHARGFLDVVDDDFVKTFAARHHQRPAAVNDEIDPRDPR